MRSKIRPPSSLPPCPKLVYALRVGGTVSSPSISVDSHQAKGHGSGKGIIGSIGTAPAGVRRTKRKPRYRSPLQ
ncbi:hypothetical protein [Sphingopyxis panaciterrae]